MAVPTGGVTRWFRDANGRIHQINNVMQITFATPLLANKYYRDSPPVVNGGAAALDSTGVGSIAVAGGTTQTVDDPGGNAINIIAPSSVIQDDNFTHVDLRFIWSPVALVFFRTTDDLRPINPLDSTFPIDRPQDRTPAQDEFDVFDVDCVFSWEEGCSIFNSSPPGWAPGED